MTGDVISMDEIVAGLYEGTVDDSDMEKFYARSDWRSEAFLVAYRVYNKDRLDGYEIRPLTREDLDRAAGVVAAISAIPSLQGGLVGFGRGLAGGCWYHTQEDAWNSEESILVHLYGHKQTRAQARAAVIRSIADLRVDHAADREDAQTPEDRAYEDKELRVLEFADDVA